MREFGASALEFGPDVPDHCWLNQVSEAAPLRGIIEIAGA
jgi:hypothetical protein